MKVQVLKSKLHGIRVTRCEIDYEGSITIDLHLIEEANFVPYERVEVYNITNGERFSTYLIPGKPDSGECILNGAAARKGTPGDRLIVVSYALIDLEESLGHYPHILILDEKNKIKEKKKKR